ncbi:hypothetical protein EG68_01379, partial [Paragonimus skrjabini miyazakii]
ISERHKSLNEYFWILGERLDLPISTVIRVLTEHGGESLNLGFLRYSPFLNPEDCDGRSLHPYMISVAKRLFGCDLQHLPMSYFIPSFSFILKDRVSATIHQIIKLTLVFTIHTEGEQPNERPLSCNGMQPTEVYNLGLSLYTRFQKAALNWDWLTFYSLMKVPNGTMRFRATARFSLTEKHNLTTFGRELKQKTLVSGLFANRFWTFHGQLLRLGTVLEEPWTMCDHVLDTGQLINATGMTVDLLDILKERFNFTYELYQSSDGKYGSLKAGGRWTGLLGDLMAKRIEFVAASLTITKERSQYFRFIGPFMDETVGILLRTPDSTTGLFQMLQPFKSHIWFLIFGSVLIVGFLLYAINRFSAWYHNRMGEGNEYHREEVQLSENMWSTIKSLLFQVPETYPSVASARTILLSFWLLVLLTHVFWQADMTAYLTRNEQILPVNSLEELAEQNRIKPVLVKGTATHDAFKDPNANRLYQLIYEKYKLQSLRIKSFSDVIRLVLNDSRYAVVAEQNALTYAVRKHCGQLVLLTNNGENRNLGFAAPAKAVYVETLSKL